ncbi:MAG: hypothetical protein Q8S09_02950 [Hyphomonas sp.]|nr:hypothetical protein [Hyphomonas sp.]
MSAVRRAAAAQKILSIRELQTFEAKAALAAALKREASCEAELDTAAQGLASEREAWQSYLLAGKPAPAILRAFGAGIARLAQAHAQTRASLAAAATGRSLCEAGVRTAVMREDLARRTAQKHVAKCAHLAEARREDRAEEQTTYAWSRP